MAEKFRTWNEFKNNLSYVKNNPERIAVISALAKHDKLNEETYREVANSLNASIDLVREIGDGISTE